MQAHTLISACCFATYWHSIYIDVEVVCWFIGWEVSSSCAISELVPVLTLEVLGPIQMS
jgi:hypothetical protein